MPRKIRIGNFDMVSTEFDNATLPGFRGPGAESVIAHYVIDGCPRCGYEGPAETDDGKEYCPGCGKRHD